MTTKEVIFAFTEKRKAVGGSNIHSYGDKLFSYNTCIGQWYNDCVILNETRYSITTSKHQTMLEWQLNESKIDIIYVHRVIKCEEDLIKYLKP